WAVHGVRLQGLLRNSELCGRRRRRDLRQRLFADHLQRDDTEQLQPGCLRVWQCNAHDCEFLAHIEYGRDKQRYTEHAHQRAPELVELFTRPFRIGFWRGPIGLRRRFLRSVVDGGAWTSRVSFVSALPQPPVQPDLRKESELDDRQQSKRQLDV